MTVPLPLICSLLSHRAGQVRRVKGSGTRGLRRPMRVPRRSRASVEP